jgi:alkanesulfonate monooxygenase SsuD/methylene tetrahydromethanopterin reductase-like flavin-dependent oxidoreductase (luciferase family)
MGIERAKPLTAVREMVSTCRELFSGERVDFEGETVRFVRAALNFGRSDIDFWLAGRGPRMMRLGGEAADGFTLSYVHKEILGRQVADVRAAAAGRRGPRIAYTTRIVSTDADMEGARRDLSFRLVDQPPAVHELLALTPDDVEALRAALAAGGPAEAAQLVRDEWVLPFVVAGTPQECRVELLSLIAEHDIDEFQLPVEDLDDAERVMADVAGLLG